MSSPLKIENEDTLREAKERIFPPSAESGWVLLNYTGPDQVRYEAHGTGDLEELKTHLKHNAVQYAKIRLGGITEKGTLKTTVRDVFILHYGKDVSILEKGLKAEFLNRAQFYLQPYHAEVKVTNKDHLDLDTLLERSHPLSGSHEIN